jgi:hypothetical protein
MWGKAKEKFCPEGIQGDMSSPQKMEVRIFKVMCNRFMNYKHAEI